MASIAEDQISNRIRQLSIFLPNRLGALLSVNRTLEATKLQVRGISILDASDHAVIRLIVDQPTLAAEILKTAGLTPVETDVLGVALAPGTGIRRLLTAVIAAELNIHYLYSLAEPREGRTIFVLHVEEPNSAARHLMENGMELIDQGDLR